MAHQDVPTLATLRDLVWCLKYSDLKDRKDAIDRLSEVAHSIGIDRTVEELIPFMQVLIIRNEDLECLNSLLDQLMNLAPFLAGSNCVHQLMPSFESLLKTADECVQTRTVDCLKLYSKDVSSSNFELHFKPHLHRLSTDTCVSTRRIACRLYSTYYPRVPFAHKEDLLNDYGQLCQDSAVCVRWSAADNLGELSKVVDFERLRSAVIPQFISLAQDEVETIRVVSVDTFLRICGKLIPRNVEQMLMPTFMKLVDDNSYRVRLQIATTMLELQKAVGVGMSKNYLVPAMAKFMNDSTADVRTATVVRTYEFCSNLEMGVRESFVKSCILPQVERLCCDPSREVRIATCDLLKLASYITLESVQKYLVPSAISLLRNDCHQVQSRAASNIGHIKKALDIAVLSNVINAEMLVAVKQRKTEKLLRIVDCLPLLVAELGEEFMDEKLLEFVISTEKDHSNVLVKVTILNAMRKVVSILKRTWVNLILLPHLITLLGKRTVDADEQCFIWTQVLLMGFPAGFTDSGILSLLGQLNDRSVDKSELRSVVFHAVKEAKNDLDDDVLKNAMDVLEDTLFRDSVDKEFLQLALIDSDPTSPAEEANLISKDPPKLYLATVQLREKRHRVNSLTIPSNRFSLPATPLFEGTNFDFTQIIPMNNSTASTYYVTSRRRGQIGSRPTSWSLASRMSVEESINHSELPVLIGVDEKELEPILIENSEVNPVKETECNDENESSVLIKIDTVADVRESRPEENHQTNEEDLANDQLVSDAIPNIFDQSGVEERSQLVAVTQKSNIDEYEQTGSEENHRQTNPEDDIVDDQPESISDHPNVKESIQIVVETQQSEIGHSELTNGHEYHQIDEADIEDRQSESISDHPDMIESNQIVVETQRSDMGHSDLTNEDHETDEVDIAEDQPGSMQESDQICVELQTSDVDNSELNNDHKDYEMNEGDLADDQLVSNSIPTNFDQSGVDEESLLVGVAQKMHISQSGIVDVQETCHSDHATEDKDLMDDQLVNDTIQTISDESYVEDRHQPVVVTHKSDGNQYEPTIIEENGYKIDTNENVSSEVRQITDVVESVSDQSSTITENQNIDSEQEDGLVIDINESQQNDVYKTSIEDLASNQPDTVRSIVDQSDVEKSSQLVINPQKLDDGQNEDLYTNEKVSTENSLISNVVENFDAKEHIEVVVESRRLFSQQDEVQLIDVQENLQNDIYKTDLEDTTDDHTFLNVFESSSSHSVQVHRVVVESHTSYSNVYNVQSNHIETENHGNEDHRINIEDSTNDSRSHELTRNISSHSVVVESHTSISNKDEMQLIDYQTGVQEYNRKDVFESKVEDQQINNVIHEFIHMDERNQVYTSSQKSENDQDEALSIDNDEHHSRHVRFLSQPQMISISVDEYANSGGEDLFDNHNSTSHGAVFVESEITVSKVAEDEKFQDAEDQVVTNGNHENNVIVSRDELKSTQTFFDLMSDDDTIEV